MPAVCVEFDIAIQSLDVLKEAAYRFLPFGSCNLRTKAGVIACLLETPDSAFSEGELRQRFLAIVTDENVREKIEVNVSPVRDLILSLAFGALSERA